MKSVKYSSDTVHTFAVYCSSLQEAISNKAEIINLTSSDSMHRIVRVLRLSIEDPIILFDDYVVVEGIVRTIKKDAVIITIISSKPHLALLPSITVILPLLKKEDVERAINGLVAVGVNKIQLVITEKTHKRSFTHHEYERYIRIVRAAQEQAKQFIPVIIEPLPQLLYTVIKEQNSSGVHIYADIEGRACIEYLTSLKIQSISSCTIVIGPEGGLTMHEKEYLQSAGYRACALTPTILEAWLASVLMAGIVRTGL